MTKIKGFNLNSFYSSIFRHYDLMNKLFTFGLDLKWRSMAIKQCLDANPESVLDLCTGTGDLAISLSRHSKKNLSIKAYDMNHDMLGRATEKASGLTESRPEFIQGKASELPFQTNSFDSIVIGFGFRNLTFNNPEEQKHIDEMKRVLKPGGQLFILESSVPQNPFIRFAYLLHLYLVVIPMGGILTGNFKAYWYLAHSASKYYTIQQLEQLFVKNGFRDFWVKRFLFGSACLIKVRK